MAAPPIYPAVIGGAASGRDIGVARRHRGSLRHDQHAGGWVNRIQGPPPLLAGQKGQAHDRCDLRADLEPMLYKGLVETIGRVEHQRLPRRPVVEKVLHRKPAATVDEVGAGCLVAEARGDPRNGAGPGCGIVYRPRKGDRLEERLDRPFGLDIEIAVLPLASVQGPFSSWQHAHLHPSWLGLVSCGRGWLRQGATGTAGKQAEAGKAKTRPNADPSNAVEPR
jgi:hypothetical protein